MSDVSNFGKKVKVFRGNASSLMYIDNKKKDILILGKDLTNELDDTILTAGKEYSINFSKQ